MYIKLLYFIQYFGYLYICKENLSNIEDYIVALCDILIKSLESFASALEGNFSRKKWNRSSAISPRGKWKINPTCPDLFLLDRAVEKQTNTYTETV